MGGTEKRHGLLSWLQAGGPARCSVLGAAAAFGGRLSETECENRAQPGDTEPVTRLISWVTLSLQRGLSWATRSMQQFLEPPASCRTKAQAAAMDSGGVCQCLREHSSCLLQPHTPGLAGHASPVPPLHSPKPSRGPSSQQDAGMLWWDVGMLPQDAASKTEGCCRGMLQQDAGICSRTRDPPVQGGVICPQQSFCDAFAQGAAACPSPPESQSSRGLGL